MTEMIHIGKDELKSLKDRLEKLASEKSYLNLLIHMMSRLGTVSGLENTVEAMLQVILNNIGGTNLILYYFIDDSIYFADVFGKRMKLDVIEDASVKEVFLSREPVVHEHDFNDTMMMTPEFTKAMTWIFPLLVGSDLVGILKMDGMHMGTGALRQQLPTFFSYAALILKNVILGHTRLRKAYDEARQTNAELMKEIAERRRAEEALLNSEEKLKAVVYGSPIPQFVIDSDHAVVYWNKALEEVTGIRASEVVGTSQHWQAFYGTERPCMVDLMVEERVEEITELYGEKCTTSKLVTGAFEVTDYFPALGEGGKWLYFTGVAIRDAGGRIIGALETLEDITERKRLEEKLLAQSIIDELTGLYNRRGFLTLAQQQLNLAERAKKRIVLFFMDLDRMKWINDTLGHQTGDAALVEVASALRQTFRKSDIIGRMGGDEFAVLAIDAAPHVEETVTRLRKCLDNRAGPGTSGYRLSLSVGAAHFDAHSPTSLDDLICEADNLMYGEKRMKQTVTPLS